MWATCVPFWMLGAHTNVSFIHWTLSGVLPTRSHVHSAWNTGLGSILIPVTQTVVSFIKMPEASEVVSVKWYSQAVIQEMLQGHKWLRAEWLVSEGGFCRRQGRDPGGGPTLCELLNLCFFNSKTRESYQKFISKVILTLALGESKGCKSF